MVAWSGQAHEGKQPSVNEVYWIRDSTAAIPVYDYTGKAGLPQHRQATSVTGIRTANPSGRVA